MVKRYYITDADVKEFLRNKEQIIDSCKEKIINIKKDLENNNEMIEAVSLSSKPITDMPKGNGGIIDLSSTFERYEKKLKEREEEYKELLWYVMAKEEAVRRVWACLYLLNDPYYWIMNKLYVEGNLYAAVEYDYGKSHKQFETKRKEAIESILDLYYHCDMTTDQMILKANSITHNDVFIKSKSKENEMEQLNLEDMFG